MSTATIAPVSDSDAGLPKPSTSRAVRNGVAATLVYVCMGLALIPLLWVSFVVVSKGYHLLLQPEWWTNSQQGVTIRREGGGAYHAIIGTLLQAGACAIISIPVGVLTAVYLVEYGRGTFSRIVTFMVDILTGVPSIVAALFIYSLWVTTFHFQRAGIAVSLALVLLMIPVVVRSTEEMLKLVPNELREASYALGVPTWKTILSIVLPTAFSGIVTGILLGLARVMGETAPLLILVGYSKAINTNLFEGFMGALPLMINQERTESLQPAVDRTWAAALTLILLVLLLNVLGRLIARRMKVRN